MGTCIYPSPKKLWRSQPAPVSVTLVTSFQPIRCYIAIFSPGLVHDNTRIEARRRGVCLTPGTWAACSARHLKDLQMRLSA